VTQLLNRSYRSGIFLILVALHKVYIFLNRIVVMYVLIVAHLAWRGGIPPVEDQRSSDNVKGQVAPLADWSLNSTDCPNSTVLF